MSSSLSSPSAVASSLVRQSVPGRAGMVLNHRLRPGTRTHVSVRLISAGTPKPQAADHQAFLVSLSQLGCQAVGERNPPPAGLVRILMKAQTPYGLTGTW
jgi:hypothetical protein